MKFPCDLGPCGFKDIRVMSHLGLERAIYKPPEMYNLQYEVT